MSNYTGMKELLSDKRSRDCPLNPEMFCFLFPIQPCLLRDTVLHRSLLRSSCSYAEESKKRWWRTGRTYDAQISDRLVPLLLVDILPSNVDPRGLRQDQGLLSPEPRLLWRRIATLAKAPESTLNRINPRRVFPSGFESWMIESTYYSSLDRVSARSRINLQ